MSCGGRQLVTGEVILGEDPLLAFAISGIGSGAITATSAVMLATDRAGRHHHGIRDDRVGHRDAAVGPVDEARKPAKRRQALRHAVHLAPQHAGAHGAIEQLDGKRRIRSDDEWTREERVRGARR